MLMSDWMELELAERLAPVRAPEALWARVNRPTTAAFAPRAARWRLQGFVFAAAIMASATLSRQPFTIPSPSLSQLAAAELAKSLPADFQSTDPHAIARWLRANAAVDVSLPAAASVQFTGARAIQNKGALIGEVLYRVEGRDAVLLVARTTSPASPTRHGQPAWQAHGQVYALAYAVPEQSRLACQLCHID